MKFQTSTHQSLHSRDKAKTGSSALSEVSIVWIETE